MAGYSREVARRVFSEELRHSDMSFREGEDQNQYAPSYLLTPTGARCNRVFIVGALTERDDIGGEAEYWRARVVDPTGSSLVYAGQYQPDAAQVIAGLEPPAFVAVVGKPSLYETEDGRKIVSIRAESVQKVDEDTRNRWIVDTAKRTIERVVRMEAFVRKGMSTTGSFQQGDVYTPAKAHDDDLERARLHYETDLETYRQMALQALRSLRQDENDIQGSRPEGAKSFEDDEYEYPERLDTTPLKDEEMTPQRDGEPWDDGEGETKPDEYAPKAEPMDSAKGRQRSSKKTSKRFDSFDAKGADDVEDIDFSKIR